MMKLICKQMHLVDKCLLIFMVVLLLQSAYNLFFNHLGASVDNNGVDVMVRTFSSSIFGYFLSANFIRRSRKTPDDTTGTNPDSTIEYSGPPITQNTPNPEDAGQMPAVKGQMGFSLPVLHARHQMGHIQEMTQTPPMDSDREEEPENRLQILVAASIGLFCLLALILARNLSVFYPEFKESVGIAATAAQFRDFISGCIGFLIGIPTDGINRNISVK